MGILNFSTLQLLSGLFTPVKSMAAPVAPQYSHDTNRRQSTEIKPISARKLPWLIGGTGSALPRCKSDMVKANYTRQGSVGSRIKVISEFVAGGSQSTNGRLIISGRMSDVCAELERMTELELKRSAQPYQ